MQSTSLQDMQEKLRFFLKCIDSSKKCRLQLRALHLCRKRMLVLKKYTHLFKHVDCMTAHRISSSAAYTSLRKVDVSQGK